MLFSYSCEKTHTIDGTDYAFKAEGNRFVCEVTNKKHIELFTNNGSFKPVNPPKAPPKPAPNKHGTRRSKSVSDVRMPRNKSL